MKNISFFLYSFSKVAIANLITKPLWVLLFIFAARELGTEQFGIYTYAISVVIIISIFIDFGFDYIAVRDISQNSLKLTNKFSEVGLSRLILSSITVFLIFIYAYLFKTFDSFQFKTVVIVLFFQIAIINSQFIRSIASALQDFSLYAKMIVFDKGLLIVFGFAILQVSKNLENFLLVLLLANIISVVAFIVVLKKKYQLKFVLPEKSSLLSLFKNSAPLLVMNIFIMAYFRIDVILLDYLVKDKSIVGVYGTIHRIIEMYFLIPTIIMSTAYPIISKYYSDNKEFVINLVNKILFSLSAITLPFIIVISFNAFEINYFIFGAEYIEGYKGLQYIIWTILPLGFNYVLGYLLISINKQFYCALSIAFASIINIALNIILIPKLSFVGTSIAMLVTEVVIFCFYAFFTLKYFARIDLKNLIIKVVSILVITFLCFFVMKIYIEYNTLLYISVFLVLSLLLISIFRVIKIDDLKKLIVQITDRKSTL